MRRQEIAMTAEKSPTLSRGKHKVLLVDDHPLVRRGLADLLGREPDLEMCGEACDVSEALREVERTSPDLVVIDLTLKARPAPHFTRLAGSGFGVGGCEDNCKRQLGLHMRGRS
jgi:CheY-like chemotaxis protein